MRAGEITAILGPVDEAWTWANADEAMINEGRAMASGRVLALIALLESVEEDGA